MGIWYASREDVKASLDIQETARNNVAVDRAIESASRNVEGLLHRRFYPELDTRYFDWPNRQYARPWRLWLGSNEMSSITTLVSGGTTLSAADYFLRNSDDKDEPPYDSVELDLDSSATFGGGSTHQKDIAITGVYIGCPIDETPVGTAAEALDSSETGFDVSDSGIIGVGHIIRVDDERMIVTGKSMLDTAVDIHATDSLTASNADVSILLTTATAAPIPGEVILIDSERMLVVDIAGTTLTVKRAWDGTVLATHAAGAGIYAPRTLTVVRGSLGTTAASHLTSAPIYRFNPPGPVVALTVAEAVSSLLNESAGYARTAGSGDNAREAAGRALKDARDQARQSHGRRARVHAV